MKKWLAILSVVILAASGAWAVSGNWTSNEFIYKPAYREAGESAKNTYDTGQDKVDKHLGAEKTLGDPHYTTLAEALTTIGSSQISLRVPYGNYEVSANTTIPANVNLRVMKGATLDVQNGVTLTINGTVEAGPYKIFTYTGTGTVVMTSSPTVAVVQWWGATGDGTANQETYINRALTAAKKVYVPPSSTYYELGTPVLVPSGRELFGDGIGTILKAKSGFDRGTPLIRNSTLNPATEGARDTNISVHDFTLDGNRTANPCDITHQWLHGVLFNCVSGGVIKSITMLPTAGDAVSVNYSSMGDVHSTDISISNIRANYVGRNGISVTGGERVTIQDVIVTDPGLCGIDVEPDNNAYATCKDITISNVIVENVQTTYQLTEYGTGIQVCGSGTTHPIIKNVALNNCVVRNATGATYTKGFQFRYVQDLTVTGCQVDGATSECFGSGSEGAPVSKHWSFVGCTARNGLRGFGIAREYTSVTGCQVTACTYGISIWGNNFLVENNQLDACTTHGIEIIGADHGKIANNSVNNCNNAIYPNSDTDYLSFTGNHITNNNLGFYCSGTLNKCVFSKNVFYNNNDNDYYIGYATFTNCDLGITGRVTVNESRTIDSTNKITVDKGGYFYSPEARTLTIQCPIEAGPYKIFGWSASGAFNLSASPTKKFPWHWWGISPEPAYGTYDNYDNSGALQKALDSLGGQQDLLIPEGVWRITSPVVMYDNHGVNGGSMPGILGESYEKAIIYANVGAGVDALVFGDYSHWCSRFRLKNLAIVGPADCARHLLRIECAQGLDLENIDVQGGATSFAVFIGQVENSKFDWRRGWGAGYRSNSLGMGDYIGTEKYGIYMGPAIKPNTLTPTYVDAKTFTLPGRHDGSGTTDKFANDQIVFLDLGTDGKVFGYTRYRNGVVYNSGPDNTTINLVQPILTSNLANASTNDGGGSWGSGTSTIVRMHQSFQSFGARGLFCYRVGDFTLEEGDIENSWGGDGQWYMGGTWPWTSDRVALYSGATTKLGQTFTLTQDTYIDNVVLTFRKVNSPHGDVTCSIYNTSAGVPTTLYATMGDKQAAIELNGGNLFYYTYRVGMTLPAGTYWIGGEYSGGDASNYVDIGAATTLAGQGGYDGTCYYYDGTWHSTNYSMRYTINARPAVEFQNCTDVYIKHQHMEANSGGDLLIDRSRLVDIQNYNGTVNITRSSLVNLTGSGEQTTKFFIDPLSQLTLGNVYMFPDSTSYKDFGNVTYTGYSRDWNGRRPINLPGSPNGQNYAQNFNYLRFDSVNGKPQDSWSKDANATWTRCGDGDADTTKHLVSHCLNLTTSASDVWNYWTVTNSTFMSEILDALKGKWITVSFWIMFPNTTTPYGYWQLNQEVINGGASNWSASTTYEVGDQVKLNHPDEGWTVFTCVGRGVSGATTPTLTGTSGVTMDYVSDGTVLWCMDGGNRGQLNGGNIDSSWADNKWRRITTTVFIPNNCINISGVLRLYNGTQECYIAEPCVNIGMQPLSGATFPVTETMRDFVQIGKYRIYMGYTGAPADGRWCEQGDIWLRQNLSPGTSTSMGWGCTTAGTAGGTATISPLPNLP